MQHVAHFSCQCNFGGGSFCRSIPTTAALCHQPHETSITSCVVLAQVLPQTLHSPDKPRSLICTMQRQFSLSGQQQGSFRPAICHGGVASRRSVLAAAVHRQHTPQTQRRNSSCCAAGSAHAKTPPQQARSRQTVTCSAAASADGAPPAVAAPAGAVVTEATERVLKLWQEASCVCFDVDCRCRAF